jgi:hypothetical protein
MSWARTFWRIRSRSVLNRIHLANISLGMFYGSRARRRRILYRCNKRFPSASSSPWLFLHRIVQRVGSNRRRSPSPRRLLLRLSTIAKSGQDQLRPLFQLRVLHFERLLIPRPYLGGFPSFRSSRLAGVVVPLGPVFRLLFVRYWLCRARNVRQTWNLTLRQLFGLWRARWNMEGGVYR